MKHWSVNVSTLKKDPKAYAIWKLEEAVNHGIREGKIKKSELRAHWNKLRLDPWKKKLLASILAGGRR